MQTAHGEETARRASADAAPAERDEAIADLRFRRLVGEEAWRRLPEAVRARFSKRLGNGETIVYQGAVVRTELSRAGRALAFLARAIGGPLPRTHGMTGAAVVVVTEDAGLRGQSWTRIYACAGRAPQVVHSTKRFCGATGLEEYVGYGVGMALVVGVDNGALVFRSDRYFVEIGGWRLDIPRALAPGVMEITHRDEARDHGPGVFSFRLRLRHPIFGQMLEQLAYFRDA